MTREILRELPREASPQRREWHCPAAKQARRPMGLERSHRAQLSRSDLPREPLRRIDLRYPSSHSSVVGHEHLVCRMGHRYSVGNITPRLSSRASPNASKHSFHVRSLLARDAASSRRRDDAKSRASFAPLLSSGARHCTTIRRTMSSGIVSSDVLSIASMAATDSSLSSIKTASRPPPRASTSGRQHSPPTSVHRRFSDPSRPGVVQRTPALCLRWSVPLVVASMPFVQWPRCLWP